MIEFALVAPVFFFLLFGVIEFGVLMFDVGTTRFASGEAAKVEAQVGNGQATCNQVAGCVAVFANPAKLCYADCQALSAIHNTAVGSTSLEQVNYVEIQKMQDTGGGNFQPVSPAQVNRYTLTGSTIAGYTSYTETTRDVIAGQTDYLQVNINFKYRWLTGFFNSLLAQPVLDSKYLVKLEPQSF